MNVHTLFVQQLNHFPLRTHSHPPCVMLFASFPGELFVDIIQSFSGYCAGGLPSAGDTGAGQLPGVILLSALRLMRCLRNFDRTCAANPHAPELHLAVEQYDFFSTLLVWDL